MLCSCSNGGTCEELSDEEQVAVDGRWAAVLHSFVCFTENSGTCFCNEIHATWLIIIVHVHTYSCVHIVFITEGCYAEWPSYVLVFITAQWCCPVCVLLVIQASSVTVIWMHALWYLLRAIREFCARIAQLQPMLLNIRKLVLEVNWDCHLIFWFLVIRAHAL